MIFLINYFSEKIGEFKRRNRNKRSYYKYFLIWISLIILITAIFYCINRNINKNVEEIYPLVSNITELPMQLPERYTELSTQLPERYDVRIPPVTVAQSNIMDIPKTNVSRNLYDEVLRTVNKIPPPLNFVDDVKFEI